MKRTVIIFLLSSLLAACSQHNPLSVQTGTIVLIEDFHDGLKQMLVVPDIKEDDFINKTKHELISLAQEKGGAYYTFKPDKMDGLKVGAHVVVYWDGTQDDSSPPQRKAKEIEPAFISKPIEGYIVFLKDNRTILINDENFNIHELDVNGGLKEIQRKYDVMILYVDDIPKDIKSGEKVRVGARQILESYPPKVYVSKIEKIND